MIGIKQITLKLQTELWDLEMTVLGNISMIGFLKLAGFLLTR